MVELSVHDREVVGSIPEVCVGFNPAQLESAKIRRGTRPFNLDSSGRFKWLLWLLANCERGPGPSTCAKVKPKRVPGPSTCATEVKSGEIKGARPFNLCTSDSLFGRNAKFFEVWVGQLASCGGYQCLVL